MERLINQAASICIRMKLNKIRLCGLYNLSYDKRGKVTTALDK